MIRPSENDYKFKSKPSHIVPIVKEIRSDFITPVEAFYAVDASYLLESAEKGLQVGRYSFLGVNPEVVVEIHDNHCIVKEDGYERSFTSSDPLRIIGEILKTRTYLAEGDLSPFPGGAVGYIGYEMIRHWERTNFDPAKPSLGLPDSVFMLTRINLVFDNLLHSLKIICNVKCEGNSSEEYSNAIKEINDIENLLTSYNSQKAISDFKTDGIIKSSMTKESYTSGVEKIKKLITEGEAIQVVLSQRMNCSYSGDPFNVYRALRTINPSPYMFYLKFEDFSIFGASPEVMVKVDGDKAMLRPIAGTRPRGKKISEDMALKTDLLSDEKEKAEHIMLVDLARNDLGKIAKKGSVGITRYMDVEMYSHVMHIVSEVTATLDEKSDIYDVIAATFPAGTVSGAPKVRAMEIIEDFEPVKRGPYAGLIGYFSYTGNFDSCITIRSITATAGKLFFQAGAGIVFDSVPEKEYQETLNKARALIEAVKSGRI